MTKKIIIIIALTLAMLSCGMTANLGTKVKQIEVGMTKQEVISIIGKSYHAMGATKTPDGTLESIRYDDMMDTTQYYAFHFLNGRLVEWRREYTMYNPNNNHNHD